MNQERTQTAKGCIEYADPDLRSWAVPVRVPPNMVMYRVCGNGCCMNPKHMYFVDGDTAHQIEMAIRDQMLGFLRQYFRVNPDTLEPLPKPPPPAPDMRPPTDGEPARIWLPRR